MIIEIEMIALFLEHGGYHYRLFRSRNEIIIYNNDGHKIWLIRGYNAPDSLFMLYRVNYMDNDVELLTEASRGLIGADRVIEILEEGT